MKGTLVNSAAVLIGSLSGVMLKKGIPAKYQQTIMHGLALAVGLIGLKMALKTENVLIVILSLIIGGILGEALNIDDRLTSFGNWMTAKLGSQYGNVGQAFITASLVYCVGAMAVVGSIQDGLAGDAATLYAKSMLDGISSVVFASTLGIGVAISSISILIYQGTITLLAGLFGTVLTDAAVREMTAVGGLLIVAISLMMMEVKTIKVANLLPAIFVAVLLAVMWPL